MTEELKETADHETSSAKKTNTERKRPTRRQVRTPRSLRVERHNNARASLSAKRAEDVETVVTKPRRKVSKPKVASETTQESATISVRERPHRGPLATKPSKSNKTSKTGRLGKAKPIKGVKSESTKTEKTAQTKKFVTKIGQKASRAGGKIEKSEKSRTLSTRSSKPRDTKRTSKRDDNFGNSIYYQPKRQNLRTLRSDQPMHWEPIDPYHPSNQALSLPQTMPDEDYPMRSRSSRGKRSNAKPVAKKRFRSNRGDW